MKMATIWHLGAGLGMEKEDLKRIMQEALKDWLNDKFAEFGKLSLGAIAAAALAAMTYLILAMNGWHR